MTDTFNAVRDAIQEITGIDKCNIQKSHKPRADLGMDSLDMIEVAMLLENKFRLNFSNADLMSISDNPNATIGDYVNIIEKYNTINTQRMKFRTLVSKNKIKTK